MKLIYYTPFSYVLVIIYFNMKVLHAFLYLVMGFLKENGRNKYLTLRDLV